ncbi:MAG: OsmC family protein [Holosporales bacterium]
MSDTLITAKIEENGQSPYAVDIEVSGHRLLGDEPAPFGGGDHGPAPYDLLTAALGECTAMTIRWYARQQNWPLEKVIVHITHRKEEKTDIFTKSITLLGENLTSDQRQKLMEISAKCPIQRTLEGTPVIQTL